MTEDFYCDEVLSGKTPVNKVIETENVLAYYHTLKQRLFDIEHRNRSEEEQNILKPKISLRMG